MKRNVMSSELGNLQISITIKQEKAIVSLLNEATTKRAAKAAGVSEVTLWRWLQDKSFRAFYMEARRLAVQRAIARTQTATSEAVETLREVMKTAVANPSARVAAAKAIFDFAMKRIELEDHERRLAEIEEALADKR
jgi:uncharacterized protein YggE